eukprot:TRINITY_DN4545_c0_g1_i6.p3 TRINITY_DN4545_c0_g1~~TRINITY_DN4545_c0_g1_i6.p3  ORF type:complete len:138 (-),score=1.24 TRINITY_DN4545_c0_g1_i6:472-885(-)
MSSRMYPPHPEIFFFLKIAPFFKEVWTQSNSSCTLNFFVTILYRIYNYYCRYCQEELFLLLDAHILGCQFPFFSMYAIAQRQESDGCSQIGKLIFSKVVVYHFIYVLSGLFDKKQITIFLIQFVGFSIFLLVNKQKA